MKFYKTIGILLALPSLIYSHNQTTQQPKILVAWAQAGGCHKSMVDALKAHYGKDYEIKEFRPLETLTGLDPLNTLSLGTFNAEELYNAMLGKNMIRTTNVLAKVGRSGLKFLSRYCSKKLKEYFEKEKPKLVISVIPFLNYEMLVASNKLDIPFLLIAPDLNISEYFTHKPTTYPFAATLLFDDTIGWNGAKKAGVTKETIKATGFPLRSDFFTQKNVARIKKEWNIPPDKPVVMILMGGAGSGTIKTYFKELTRLKELLHLLVCVGKNEALKKELEAQKLPKAMTASIIGYTSKIADLMAVSDMIITKPGPTTICEAIETQTPLIIEASSTLQWERAHVQFIRKHKLGLIITSRKQITPTISRLLANKAERKQIQTRMKPWQQKDFIKKLKIIIDESIAKK